MVVEGAGRATRYRHRELHYTVRAPSSPRTLGGVDVWRRVEVKRADIAFRGPKRDFVSVISDCDAETARRPHRLASGLLVGVDNRRKVEAGVLDTSSGEGWYQIYEARFDDHPVRIKTVTMVHSECVFDWVLVSPGNFSLAERSFEAWRAGFEPAAGIGERP